MSVVAALSQIQSQISSAGAAALSTGGTNAVPEFGSVLSGAIQQVEQLQKSAAKTVEGLLSGDGTDIHTAMIATERADLAFETTLAIRNKAVAAYQQMMNLQF
jgi:flagellar hook-basal body complex protein FliE